MWLWVLGCATVGPRGLPEAWSELRWPPAGQDLHAALWRDLAQVPDDWQSPPTEASEVHVAQWWCGPSVDADACWTGAVARGETRGIGWRGLSAVTGGDATVSQLIVDSGDVPTTGSWGVALALRLDAESGDVIGWDLALTRWADTRLTARIALGPSLSYSVEQTGFEVPGPDWSGLLGSPAGFRTHATRGLDALLAEVERGLGAHEVERCSYGRYSGDGSPRCDRVPLSATEEAQAREQARAELQHRRRLVDQDAGVLHGMLRALVPATLTP